MKTEHNAILSQRRADAERELVSVVISGQPTRAEMAELATICPKGSVKGRNYDQLWDACIDIHAAGRDVDVVSVHDALTASWKGDIALTDAIASLGPKTTWPGLMEWWAGRLQEIGRLEQLQFTLEQFAGRMGDAFTESGMIVQELQAKLQELTGGEQKPETLGTLMDAIIDDVQRGVAARPLPSPWPALNGILKGGIAPGELCVLAARPGMGKTALAGCWAVETARNFGPVLFVSCEVKDRTIGSRLLAREGRIDNRAFREGLGHSQSMLPQMQEAAASLRGIPLQIVDTSRQTITPMQVRMLARKIKGLRMVVVDYLQLMYPDTRQDSREREIADMSRSMKRLAVEMDCPVLLLSQLNRKVEEGNREPQLSDLRESGAVEQDADIVIMLHNPDKQDMGADLPVNVLVRKGRSSGTGSCGLIFHKAFSDFEEGTYIKRQSRRTAEELGL